MVQRRVLILKGSPRKRGNSATLADRVAAGASGMVVQGPLALHSRLSSCLTLPWAWWPCP